MRFILYYYIDIFLFFIILFRLPFPSISLISFHPYPLTSIKITLLHQTDMWKIMQIQIHVSIEIKFTKYLNLCLDNYLWICCIFCFHDWLHQNCPLLCLPLGYYLPSYTYSECFEAAIPTMYHDNIIAILNACTERFEETVPTIYHDDEFEPTLNIFRFKLI